MINIFLKYSLHENLCTTAAGSDYLKILKWERENEFPWNQITCYTAANNGNLETLKWARTNRITSKRDQILSLQIITTNIFLNIFIVSI